MRGMDKQAELPNLEGILYRVKMEGKPCTFQNILPYCEGKNVFAPRLAAMARFIYREATGEIATRQEMEDSYYDDWLDDQIWTNLYGKP